MPDMYRPFRSAASPRGTHGGLHSPRGAVGLEPGGAVSVRAALLTAGLILLLLALFACDGSSPTGPRGGAIAFETVAQAQVSAVVAGERRDVVRDQRTWAEVWVDLHPGFPEPLPVVDFGRDVVVVAAMASQGCSSRVEIRGVVHQVAAVTVSVVEHPTEPGCACFAPVRPFHAVRFPRQSAPIVFAVTEGAPAACGS